MTILSLTVIMFLTKQFFSTEFNEPLGSQKWITKVNIGGLKWMRKVFL